MNPSSLGPVSSQYSAAAQVPLIKSPSLWLPKPIDFPLAAHPLPTDIQAYFVYPFTLEPHVLAQEPALHDKIKDMRRGNEEYLKQRVIDAERKKKEALNKIAPGYNPSSFLTPTSSSTLSPTPASAVPVAPTGSVSSPPKKDALSDFEGLTI